ncbi:MAG: peptide chain release factor N(5)-glutamine methyltransferase [Tannerellaceae bacterium]|nr:peptide chain release factor N(5)-glutamine methyltransferase [Tannerellaceae bacterium]
MTEAVSFIRQTLQSVYSAGEARSLANIVVCHVTGLSPYQLLSGKDRELSTIEKEKMREITERLKNREPIQYIIGECEFYGLKFRVNPSTLIPRPETEELVEEIIRDHTNSPKQILDIGTGSGCIAVSLAKKLPGAKVQTIDISPDALATAIQNAQDNNVEVAFSQADILNERNYCTVLRGTYDIIVSNPPYVTEQEKGSMEKNVLDHEPHTALFVKDQDPLLFYREIAKAGLKLLRPDGRLYFEINRQYGKETVSLLENMGYRNVIVKQDLSGNDRIVKATR